MAGLAAALAVVLAAVIRPDDLVAALIAFGAAGALVGAVARGEATGWAMLVPALYLPAHVAIAISRSLLAGSFSVRSAPPPTAAICAPRDGARGRRGWIGRQLDPVAPSLTIIPIAQGSLDVPARLPVGGGVALVVELLPTRDPKIDFGPSVAEGEAQGDDGHPFLLGAGAKLTDLSLVDEELSWTVGLMVRSVAVTVGGDVRADQPELVALDPRVGFRDGDFAIANRLDLGPGQHEPGLDRVLNVVLVEGATIRGDHTVTRSPVRLFLGAGGAFRRHSADYRRRHRQRQSTRPCAGLEPRGGHYC